MDGTFVLSETLRIWLSPLPRFGEFRLGPGSAKGDVERIREEHSVSPACLPGCLLAGEALLTPRVPEYLLLLLLSFFSSVKAIVVINKKFRRILAVYPRPPPASTTRARRRGNTSNTPGGVVVFSFSAGGGGRGGVEFWSEAEGSFWHLPVSI